MDLEKFSASLTETREARASLNAAQAECSRLAQLQKEAGDEFARRLTTYQIARSEYDLLCMEAVYAPV